MFDDVAEAIARDARARRRRCAFGRWLASLDEADAQAAEELLRDVTYNCRQLARYFTEKGVTLNDQVLSRHRNGTCCGQK